MLHRTQTLKKMQINHKLSIEYEAAVIGQERKEIMAIDLVR